MTRHFNSLKNCSGFSVLLCWHGYLHHDDEEDGLCACHVREHAMDLARLPDQHAVYDDAQQTKELHRVLQ